MKWAMVVLVVLGFALIVAGALGLPTMAAGGILIGYVLGVTHARAAINDALKRAQGLPRL